MKTPKKKAAPKTTKAKRATPKKVRRKPLYKVLVNGASCHGGSMKWSLPQTQPDGSVKPGEWQRVEGEIVPCRNGLHLTEKPIDWFVTSTEGVQIFEVEAEAVQQVEKGDDRHKVVCRAARLLRHVTNHDELAALGIFVSGTHKISKGKAIAYDSAQVSAYGSAQVSASGSAKVSASGSAQVSAYDSAQVSAYDSAQVSAYGSAQVSASGSAKVSAYGSAQVSAYGSAQVSASGSAKVSASDSAQVSAYGSAQVSASGSAKVSAYGSAQVSASGSAQVSAYDSAQVSASGSAQVSAYDSAQVSAKDNTTIVLFWGDPKCAPEGYALVIDRRDTTKPPKIIGNADVSAITPKAAA
jgi:hypothetical protein